MDIETGEWPSVSALKRPPSGHSPRNIDGRIANHDLGVRDLPANLETECFFRAQRARVKLNRFGRISER